MMHPRDLTRADAERAIEETKRALGGLQHLAVAGLLGSIEDDLAPAMVRLVSIHSAAIALIEILGDSAQQLPWDEQ